MISRCGKARIIAALLKQRHPFGRARRAFGQRPIRAPTDSTRARAGSDLALLKAQMEGAERAEGERPKGLPLQIRAAERRGKVRDDICRGSVRCGRVIGHARE